MTDYCAGRGGVEAGHRPSRFSVEFQLPAKGYRVTLQGVPVVR